jgi:hypothetical protein
MTALLPFFDEPQAPLPVAVEKSSTTVPGGGSVDVVVLVVVDVLVVDGPTLVDVVGVAEVDVVLEPGVVVLVWMITIVPGSVVAPGPGSEVAPLMSELDVAGTQNVDARTVDAGTPIVSGPAGLPVSRISRHAVEFGLVKQPPWVCPGQKRPFGSESSLVPVVSGVSVTGMMPTCWAQVPPGHCEPVLHAAPLFEPR